MEKVLKRILTAVLAVLMAVTVVQPIKISAESNQDVTLTATTESGIKVSVVRDGRAYSKETELIAVDVDSNAIIEIVNKKLKLDELKVQAVDLSYKAEGKTVSGSSWYDAEITLSGVRVNATAVLHLKKGLFGTTIETVDFEQSGDEVTFTHSGEGRYAVVFDVSPMLFEALNEDSDVKVTVVAENGAFKDGTEMTVKEAETDKVTKAVNSNNVVNAVDISFNSIEQNDVNNDN